MKENCIFCKIVHGVIPVTPLFQNDEAICIPDKNPIAPEHGLVISKNHFNNLDHLYSVSPSDSQVIIKMFELVDDFACRMGINASGYRVIINSGDDAGQTVKHLHIHIIGGTPLKNDFGA